MSNHLATRSQRLRAAATAARLSEHVRVSHLDGTVRWRKGEEVLFVVRRGPFGWCPFELSAGSQFYAGSQIGDRRSLKRKAAVRAGLLALAEREEGRTNG